MIWPILPHSECLIHFVAGNFKVSTIFIRIIDPKATKARVFEFWIRSMVASIAFYSSWFPFFGLAFNVTSTTLFKFSFYTFDHQIYIICISCSFFLIQTIKHVNVFYVEWIWENHFKNDVGRADRLHEVCSFSVCYMHTFFMKIS